MAATLRLGWLPAAAASLLPAAVPCSEPALGVLQEMEEWVQAYQPIFYQHRVDVVLAGHTRA